MRNQAFLPEIYLTMTTSKLNKNQKLALQIAMFVLLVALVIVLYPKDKKFNYFYEVGKPWNYELITASFDFPIYKTEEQLRHDRNELLESYTPYFQHDAQATEKQLESWLAAWHMNNSDDPQHLSYVRNKFENIYGTGVISSSLYERLQSDGIESITILYDNRRTAVYSLDELHTPKTAYEDIIYNRPGNIEQTLLNQYNLNLYLVENLRYDSITSENVQEDMLKNLSLTSGIVQTGEKIIDRGELVTPASYAILNSLKIESDKQIGIFKESVYVILGEVIVVVVLILFLALYLHLFRPSIFNDFKSLLFVLLLMFLMFLATSLAVKYSNYGAYFVPFAILPIIIRVFFDSRTALFVHVVSVLVASFMVSNPFVFIIIQMAAGMSAVSGLKDLTARSQLTQTAIFVFITYAAMYLGTELISEGEITRVNFIPIAYLAVNSSMLLFAYVLIYILEKLFGLISAITLVELGNVNSDLMLKFAELAPGTFQHTLQVSNLATEATKKINANSLLVRTGALYHDIGKMVNPMNFIENQSGENPLNDMTFEEAAQSIIKHVEDGVFLAKKHSLPEQIIGFITSHHGRSQTKYFYNSFVNENPGVEPDVEKFTYPGPLPYSKETAILMMADAVEARSRSLPEYTEESIAFMVDDMINIQIADGQFRDAPISFKDVETVKEVFIEKIKNIYHSRIAYPKLNDESGEDEGEQSTD